MLRARPLSTFARRSSRLPRLSTRRNISSKPKVPTTAENAPRPPGFIEESLTQHAVFTIGFFKRFLRFTAIGLALVGCTTLTAFEAAHLWVENVELAPDTDPEVHKWEWNKEAEKWTGGEAGGTDPGLGFTGQHAVRGAWMALNWGTGNVRGAMNAKAVTGKADDLNAVEARLQVAHDFLNVAIQKAVQKSQSGKLRPETLRELLQRHAQVLELMGTRDTLFQSRKELERVWSMLPGKGIEASRTALKLGNLNQRLGDNDEALAWWARAIRLAQDNDAGESIDVPLFIPNATPSSPSAQRTLISTLVSLSAYHATNGQLRQAQQVEEQSLNLLRSIRQPESFETTTRPHALHALYILHRSSLLSIHLAEVLYALRSKSNTSMEWLTRAAESSERVAFTLAGLPLTHPDAPHSRIPHPPSSESALLPEYAKSLSMRKPARGLLRDSRRTAAEAWDLLGILAESSTSPGSMERALEYYERAIGWAGISGDRVGAIGKAGEGTLETDWQILWNNYVRIRNAVRKTEGQEKK